MNESPVHSQNQINTLINIQGLSRSFGAVEAVKKVDLRVAQGEIFGLVGPDGAGKTTILRLLCGLLNPSSGTAEVSGINVHQNPDQIRDFIGYMPQRFGL